MQNVRKQKDSLLMLDFLIKSKVFSDEQSRKIVELLIEMRNESIENFITKKDLRDFEHRLLKKIFKYLAFMIGFYASTVQVLSPLVLKFIH